MSLFQYIENPQPSDLPETEQLWLEQLDTPLAVLLTGKDKSRTRVLSTLLHGNEPSGFFAVYRYLQEQRRPATNILILISNVEAAKEQPFFTRRTAKSQPDINRCFGKWGSSKSHKLAKDIVKQVRKFKPEAIIDLHNTSGTGPAFAVATSSTEACRSLTSLFSQHLIETNLEMGALMERNLGCPIVTIEAGGRLDSNAHQVAYHGICQFFECYDVLERQNNVDILRHPHRFELSPKASLCFAPSKDQHQQIIISTDLERHNFGFTKAGTLLGWYRGEWQQLFSVGTQAKSVALEQFFNFDKGEIRTTKQLRLFMCTTFPEIAQQDCLFYFIDAKE